MFGCWKTFEANELERVPAPRFSSCNPANHFWIAVTMIAIAANTVIAPSKPAQKKEILS
jgi:hypothetical protein